MKNVSEPEGSVFRKKGFFIALYSCLGVVAILAVVVAFANRGGTDYEEPAVYAGADQVDPIMAQAGEEAWFRPRQTPTPTPPPVPPRTQPPAPREQAPPAAPEPPPADASDAEPPTPPAEPAPAPPAPVAETFEPFTEDDRMLWPVYGDVVMPFSMESLIFDPTMDHFRTNDNLRISASEGDPVRAGADGRVISVGNDFFRGNYVTIDHGDGWTSTFGQLMENVLVNEGDVVRGGQVIGGVGQPSISGSLNGTHVHLHITRDDQPVNPYELLTARYE
ncbi:MAG: M23 family metallopeptidase [Defluviitaleaceae bacterium]|nr:M23 family metallopeptidase [Defluviitaleaceae bacterium]